MSFVKSSIEIAKNHLLQAFETKLNHDDWIVECKKLNRLYAALLWKLIKNF